MSTSQTPEISKGLATWSGLIFTLCGAVGTIYAAIKNNDTATLAAAIPTALVALTTIGGRMAQAVALIVKTANAAAPGIDAFQEALLQFQREQLEAAKEAIPSEHRKARQAVQKALDTNEKLTPGC